MARKAEIVAAPARQRVGLPIVADGSPDHPLLMRLDAGEGRCNNGCDPCVARPAEAELPPDATEVRGRHLVLRHREPTLDEALPERIAELRRRGAETITLLTNARRLAYASYARALATAGLDRIVVKLFGPTSDAHDAHSRVPGSHEQALRGLANARAVGIEARVCFPLAEGQERVRLRAVHAAIARELTGVDPVEMPEPLVEGHANEYRYDTVLLREGAERTREYWTQGLFPMVHVQTGPMCNIRCGYCNVHGGEDQRLYSVDYVERILDDAAARIGCSHPSGASTVVDFIGGEPTLHPDLAELVRAARRRGFAKVFICTNGMRLLRPGYLDSLVEAGLTGVRFSFHDHRPEVAGALAGLPNLGPRYPEIAEMLLSRRDLHVHVYRILLAASLDALPDYIRWVAAHNRTGKPLDLMLGMPSMRGRMFLHRDLYPRLEGLRERVREAMTLARSLGIEPAIHHAPACLYPDDTSASSCLHVETTQVDAAAGTNEVLSFEGDARYGEACQRCPARTAGCHGLPAAYFDEDSAAAEAWLTPVRLPIRR